MIETLWADLRIGARRLRRTPVWTAVAVGTLALAIGASTALATVVADVLLRPLPFPEPDRLAVLWKDNTLQGWPEDLTSYPEFLDWRDRSDSFTSLAAFQPVDLTAGGDAAEPERVPSALVTPGFFRTLGVQPLAGRGFLPEEAEPGRNDVVVLREGLWRRRYGGDRDLLGTEIVVEGEPHTVVGILADGEAYPEGADVWAPLAVGENLRTARGFLWLQVVGRLAPGATLTSAQAELDTVARDLEREYPRTNTGHGIRAVDLHEQLVGGVRRTLQMLTAAVVLLVLLACANVAGLLLARTAQTERELGLRAALGARRGSLLRQSLVESLELGAVGGLLGLVLAFVGLRLLLAAYPGSLPRAGAISMDGGVLVFAAAVTVGTSLLFGLVPAVRASRPDLQGILKERSRGSSGSGRLPKLLVSAEVALALLLLVTAGLLGESFRRVQDVDPGFEPERALVLRMNPPLVQYRELPGRIELYRRVTQRLAAVPGIEEVTGTAALFKDSGYQSTIFAIEGRPEMDRESQLEVGRIPVLPGFFRVAGIPLLEGRPFDERDHQEAPPVVIVSRSVAERWWPGESPVGKRIKYGRPDTPTPWMEVVGVVDDVRSDGRRRPPVPATYLPYAQRPVLSLLLIARTDPLPLTLADEVRKAVWSVDSQQPVSHLTSLRELLDERLEGERFRLLLMGVFAVIALLLAVIGLYGLMAYTVSRDTREIGVRIALGADRRSVLGMVVARGAGLAAAGIVAGLVASWLVTPLLESLLYATSPSEPAVFAGLSALLLLVAAVASYVPARRAAAVDPATALRQE